MKIKGDKAAPQLSTELRLTTPISISYFESNPDITRLPFVVMVKELIDGCVVCFGDGIYSFSQEADFSRGTYLYDVLNDRVAAHTVDMVSRTLTYVEEVRELIDDAGLANLIATYYGPYAHQLRMLAVVGDAVYQVVGDQITELAGVELSEDLLQTFNGHDAVRYICWLELAPEESAPEGVLESMREELLAKLAGRQDYANLVAELRHVWSTPGH